MEVVVEAAQEDVLEDGDDVVVGTSKCRHDFEEPGVAEAAQEGEFVQQPGHRVRVGLAWRRSDA